MLAKRKSIALISASIFLLTASSSWAETMKIGVAANFELPLKEIIAAYQNDYSDTITYTSASTGSLKSAIIAGGNANGPYDLFLAADQASPTDLANNYPSLVEGSTFTYATGYLTLWSNNNSVNISTGLPVGFSAAYGPVAIADHISAPYGAAAWAVLQASPHYITSLPDPSVTEYSNIDTTFQAVNNNTKNIGFVAKSQVCKKVAGAETFSGTSHYVYTGSPITQKGIIIERTSRTSAQDALVSRFTNYLRTNPNALAIIQNYCYS